MAAIMIPTAYLIPIPHPHMPVPRLPRCGLRRERTQLSRGDKGASFRLRECRLRARRQFKPALDQIGVIEMAPPDERGRMGSPLTHGARVVDSHGPEQIALAALGAGHDSVGAEGAAG